MNVVELIRQKRDGGRLADEQLRELVDRYTAGDIPDYQMAAFLMAVYFQSMDAEELGAWTEAMLRSGEVLEMDEMDGVVVDKHSTGGVGDKVSLVLAPLAVTEGLKVPMISGRGLGHTGGTLDKLESIPGFDVDQTVEEFRRLVDENGCALIGQTGEIAPADRELYALRDVTGTVECIPLIASSIMSKKLAEGLQGLVLDVKIGSGAFMKTEERARELADAMIGIGRSTGTPVHAVLSDMDQPLGWAVGNAVEAAEAIDALRGEGPDDLEEITVALVCEMLAAGGQLDSSREEAEQRLRGRLRDGSALETFRTIVEAQGGDPEVCDRPREVLPTAPQVEPFEAPRAGVLEQIDAEEVGLASLELGAGRERKEDEIDPSVGLIFRRKRGAKLEAGEPILQIHYSDASDLEACRSRLERALEIGDGPAADKPLIYDRLGGD